LLRSYAALFDLLDTGHMPPRKLMGAAVDTAGDSLLEAAA